MTRYRQSFISHLQADLIEFAVHEGQDYIVAPCIAIVPGVLNQSLVPLHTIEITCQAWNGQPIMVNHPVDEDGLPISANESPSVIESSCIGRLWYANTENSRLNVQAWVNIDKAKSLGGKAATVLDKLEAKEAIEVSTGYWATLHEQDGVFNDRPYQNVTDLIIPDHLAFLPHSIGACNWADGCGVPRFNEDITRMETQPRETLKAFVRGISDLLSKSDDHPDDAENPVDHSLQTNLTITDQFTILSGLIAKEMEAEGIDLWRWHVQDIEGSTVIISFDGSLMRREFTITGDDLALAGDWEEVNRKTTFTPAEAASCACGGIQTGEDEMADVDQNQTSERDTLSEFLAAQGLSQDEVLGAIQARTEARNEHIKTIQAGFEIPEAELAAMSDETLKALAAGQIGQAVEPIQDENSAEPLQGQANFAGRGLPVQQRQKEEPFRPTPILLKKRSA